MKIDDEIELRLAHLLHKLDDAPDGNHRVPVAQADAIDFENPIRITRQFDHFVRRFADRNCDPRVWKTPSNGAQRGQAQHNIAELSEIDDEYVGWIKVHFLGAWF